MDTKKITYIAGSIFLVFGFLYGAYALTSQPEEVVKYESLTKVNKNDHVKWSNQNKIILTKYSDFECPACATYAQVLNSFASNPENKEIVDKVTYIYKHFPLDQIHPNARSSAQAAVSASLQGKFFEFHDILFEKQAEWSKSSDALKEFEKYAGELKLDIKKFNEDSKSQLVKDKVQTDFVSGNEVNVQGTPSFYLNGKKISFRSEAELKKLLQEEIDNTSSSN